MKVCIVYPPFWYVDNQPTIEAVNNNYGVYPNLSLAYVAATLVNAGHSVRFIDANALNLKKEQVLDRIKRFNPDILAFTITTYLIHQNISWIKYLKENTGLPILVGGQHMSLYPYETFTHNEIDYGIIGEAEETVVELLDALENNKDLRFIKSIIFKDKNDKVIMTQKRDVIKDLDKIPFPARYLLPNEKYYEFISQRKNFTLLMTSRGCPYKCIYCEQGGTKFRGRSAINVGDELEECYTDYNVKEVDIFDPLFTTNRKRVIEIAKDLQKRKLDIEFSVRSRVDTVDKDILSELKKAGCSRIYFGIETGNQSIMNKLNKGIKLDQVKISVKNAQKTGIKVLGYFMFGLPGETNSTIRDTIKFAKSLNLDYVEFSKTTPLPGTGLYNLYLPELGEDYWRNFVLNSDSSKLIGRPQCNITEKELQQWIKKAYMNFYFRPSYIIKAITRLRSLEEFKRSAAAALDIFRFKPSSESVIKEDKKYRTTPGRTKIIPIDTEL